MAQFITGGESEKERERGVEEIKRERERRRGRAGGWMEGREGGRH